MGTPIAAELARIAAEGPDLPALTCGGVTLTRQGLERRANAFAWRLMEHGVGQGERVALVLPNSVEFVVALLAVWKAGGTPVPVAARLPESERAAILELAEPRVIVGEGGLLPGDEESGDAPPAVLPTPWKILASGGSTGRPKLIATAHEGVPEKVGVLGLAGAMQVGGAALVPAPLSHNGPFMALAAALTFGKHVVLMQRFDAAEALRLIAGHRVDWIYFVPTMMHRIWRLPEEVRSAADISSVTSILHLAAPIAPWLKQAWIDWFGPERIWELYAGTEAQTATVISGHEWLAHRGSVGRVPEGAIEIRDPSGTVLGPGESGEVWMRVRSDAPTYHYIGASARREGEWESLGDLGHLDADGYLYLGDRQTDMILVGGSNVYPAEIEGALEEHPMVRSVAVIGLPDDDLGSVPHAIVQPAGPVTDDELRAHLSVRLAGYKLPRTFEYVTEPLRDEAGKVRRSALRKERVS